MLDFFLVVWVSTFSLNSGMWPLSQTGYKIFSEEKPAIECMIGHQGARIFKGKELALKSDVIEIKQQKAEEYLDPGLCPVIGHIADNLIARVIEWPSGTTTAYSVCRRCAKRIKQNQKDNYWSLDQ